MKIRNRLTYQFAVIVASILLIFSFAIYYFSELYRKQEFQKRLINKAYTTARLLIRVAEVDERLLRIIDKNNLSALTNEKLTIYGEDNKKLYSSDDDPEIPFSKSLFEEIKKNKEVFFTYNKNAGAGVLFSEKGNNFIIIVSALDKFGHNKIKNLSIILTIGFFCSVGIIFIGGYLFAGQALRPISHIISEVNRITASNLNVRLHTGNSQDEIAMLSITFNQMLERLEQSFKMQKSFVSNASHELRTPLTIIRAQLEVALFNERKKIEYQDILVSVLSDINNLIKLSNGLLDLAQVDAGMTSNSIKNIRIDELVYLVISDTSKKYPDKQITLTLDENLDDESTLLLECNETLLKTAIANIIDNSCKYSGTYPVKVSLNSIDEQTIIIVEDFGIGISQNDLPHILDPFFRGINARNINGHGIGLPLAHKIINVHKGKIEIHSKENQGTKIEIFLPKKQS